MNSLHTMVHKLHNPDLGNLLLRLAIGAVFIHAGWGKVNAMDMVVSSFATMGIPAVLAYFVAYAELIGGVALVLGVFVRYVGIILSVIMAVALFKVHFANGFSLQNGGYEYVYVLLLGSMALVTFGSGKYSIACKLHGLKGKK